MTILFVLITVSAIVAIFFLFLFIWSVKTGQFDDSYTPSVRILFDDAKPVEKKSKKDNSSKNENL
ncbi:MAG: cbb3-type cytochrome oxidase assembly protein CcoS [Bacteroidales bacterium]|nr:cbb3-type cytochrome oxidase assembly protein CcoS [Bacteroidales bacterium]